VITTDATRIIKMLIHILLIVVIILFIITGFGITDYHIVEQITLGLLTKPLSYTLHVNLILPFFLLLAAHLYFVFRKKQ
jgi:formate hydrogenlyase subunit 3/multisubunit Na+/H+ antiporter MnhD subunit